MSEGKCGFHFEVCSECRQHGEIQLQDGSTFPVGSQIEGLILAEELLKDQRITPEDKDLLDILLMDSELPIGPPDRPQRNDYN